VNQANKELAKDILAFLQEGPAHFEDILLRFPDASYRDILKAWGKLREDNLLGREFETGRYVEKSAEKAS
jgi:hypothetical protein